MKATTEISKGTRSAAAVSFLKLASSGKVRDAYHQHVHSSFRHHNPYYPGDAASLAAGMEANALGNPQKVLEIRTVLEDDDMVAVHSRVRLKPDGADMALVHIFRFDGDQIVELWDVGQAGPAESKNENGMF